MLFGIVLLLWLLFEEMESMLFWNFVVAAVSVGVFGVNTLIRMFKGCIA